MGRNQRHKKDVRAEKAKVKLKQSKTKFLPKGLNVTNTNFKIKPIVLVEQLKAKSGDLPLSKRNLNVKDLLSRIKHYNENVRYSASEELEQMLKTHSDEIVNHHLSEIILSISVAMQDREHKVRKAIIKVINAALETIPERKLEPFYGYFSTNLCCAMTNIDKNIQEDSLEFLDCFLKHAPNFISQTSEKLLPNFFSLISNLKSGSNIGRLLTINLNSRMTSVTWRIKVLSRLHAVLESILRRNTSKGEYMDSEMHSLVLDGNNFPIFKTHFLEVLESPAVSFGNAQTIFSGSSMFNRHIVTLIPLLYETWLEVVPEKNIGKGVTENTVLNEEASTILLCVMNTLYLLWIYLKKVENDTVNIKNTFLSKEGRTFLSHLLTNFPYCQMDKRVKQKKTLLRGSVKILETNLDPKCVRENLLICYMYCVLNINYLHNSLKIEMEGISMYITKCLLTKKYIDNSNIDILIKFLKSCLINEHQAWKRAGADVKSILESTITFYNHNMVDEKYKPHIFDILLNVADLQYGNKIPKYADWLFSLPDLLCQSKVMDTTVEALLRLSRRNNEAFNKGLLRKIQSVIDNLERLNIILTVDEGTDEESVKRNIVNMFFYLPMLYKEQIAVISNFVVSHPYSPNSVYFIDVMKLRLEMKNRGSFTNDLRMCPMWDIITLQE